MLMSCVYDMDLEHKDLSIQRTLEEISLLIKFELIDGTLFQVAMIPLLDLIVRFSPISEADWSKFSNNDIFELSKIVPMMGK